MDVIKLILSEDIAAKLTDEHLRQFALCTYASTRESVVEYLNNLEANEDVKRRVRVAFGDLLDMIDYLQDDTTTENVNLIVKKQNEKKRSSVYI